MNDAFQHLCLAVHIRASPYGFLLGSEERITTFRAMGREFDLLFISGAQVGERFYDVWNDITRSFHKHLVADPDILFPDEIFVV